MTASGEATGRDGWCCNTGFTPDLIIPKAVNSKQYVSPTKRRQQPELTEETWPGRPAAQQSWPCRAPRTHLPLGSLLPWAGQPHRGGGDQQH